MSERLRIGYGEGEISPEVLVRTRQKILDNFQALRKRVASAKNLKADQAINDGIVKIGKDFELEGKPKPPIYDAVIYGSGYRVTNEADELEIKIIDRIQELIVDIENKLFSGDFEERS